MDMGPCMHQHNYNTMYTVLHTHIDNSIEDIFRQLLRHWHKTIIDLSLAPVLVGTKGYLKYTCLDTLLAI